VVVAPSARRTPRLSEPPVDLATTHDPGAAFDAAHRSGRLLRLPTSGSTAARRHVLRTTGSWVSSFEAVSRLAGIDGGSRVWVPGPRTSTMNLFAVVHAHHAGAALVATAEGATHAVLTPAQLAGLGPAELDGLTAVVAGDRLAAAAHDRAARAGAVVHHYYGAAELSFVAWGGHDGDLRVFPGVEVEARGGELWVRSPYLCEGYDGPPGALRTDPDGFATVGDRGEVHGDHVVVRGRPGAVTTSGATVLTADVEAALAPHAEGDVVVVAAPHAHHGSVVAAVLTRAADHVRLVERARSTLGAAAQPRVWLECPDLPLTPAGKLDREALADLVAGGTLRRLT
jgi:long-chain acyl-CoA synthetase